MKTERLGMDSASIDRAVAILQSGGIVALPTETVYGLAARADRAEAVRRVFSAKGRPSTNPLIVHVASIEKARSLCLAFPEEAERLARAFWPGPLTLVLARASSGVADIVTCGGKTVAIRVPAHPVMLEVLRKLDFPLAAPSANRSTSISPTAAQHVLKTLDGSIDAVIDAGSTSFGLESTIVDVTTSPPTVLRLGAVGLEKLRGIMSLREHILPHIPISEVARAPGMSARHYAPRASLIFADASSVGETLVKCRGAYPKAGLLCHTWEGPMVAEVVVERLEAVPAAYGSGLYAALHRLEDAGCAVIVVETIPEGEAWGAVRDRLTRASASDPESAC